MNRRTMLLGSIGAAVGAVLPAPVYDRVIARGGPVTYTITSMPPIVFLTDDSKMREAYARMAQEVAAFRVSNGGNPV
jgi:hypothetical protein